MSYFVRATLDDSTQVKSIAALVQACGWREVVAVYEDTDYGRGILPYLIDALQEIDVCVPYRSVIPLSATNETIMQELGVLIAMQTRVFIVHMSSTMASLIFTKAKEVGMMNKGFAWITTNGVANIIDSLNPSVIEAMDGVLGVRCHVPRSQELDNLSIRWNIMYQQDNPYESPFNKLSIVGLWGYDTIWAIAHAAEKVGISSARDKQPWPTKNSTCLESMVISTNGPELLSAIVQNKFRGLSGEFDLTDRQQLKVSVFQIINVVERGWREIGFWTVNELLRKLKQDYSKKTGQASMLDLNPVIWPGESTEIPMGWEIPRVEFDTADAPISGSYNDFVYQVYLQKYDIAVADITIRSNRSLYVDFTAPYTESGVGMIVPVKENVNTDMWLFLKPLSTEMWFGSINATKEIRRVLLHHNQQEEELKRFLARIVLRVWRVVLLVLAASYTASFASMLTVQQLSPTVTDVHELQKNGQYVGFHQGSYVEGLLLDIGFHTSKIRPYATPDDFYSALSNGSIAALVHEVPYIKLFLAKYSKGYTMVAPIYKSVGFAFTFDNLSTTTLKALPRNSPLAPEMSRAIINITEGDTIIQFEKKWMGQNSHENDGTLDGSDAITFESFGGLFALTVIVTTYCLLVAMVMSCYKRYRQNARTIGEVAKMNVGMGKKKRKRENRGYDQSEYGHGQRKKRKWKSKEITRAMKTETELIGSQTTLSVLHNRNRNGHQLPISVHH
ncbi:hypothetical protein CFC21_066322 [Triticum aestivum]|uniref:Ionotropic glutamate receptor C-terminal domain-containing protein n=2 Tax=Triticum aestivum TaxID=4565 RepID=A0A3B6KKV4_WHEAT|nr:hypothetical protein CFC21_066322 [Triticum aestivum]